MPFTYDYPRPCVSVDCVIFRREGDGLQVLLINRKNEPFRGLWALPGGFVDMGETLEQAACRELHEETGLEGIAMEQLQAFSEPGRDPRARTITVVFYGFAAGGNDQVHAMDDAAMAGWFWIKDLPPLAFDHDIILEKAVRKISRSSGYSP